MGKQVLPKTVGLDRTVVSIVHCGCTDLGSIPSLDKFCLLQSRSLYFLGILTRLVVVLVVFWVPRFATARGEGFFGSPLARIFIWDAPRARSARLLSNGPIPEERPARETEPRREP